jgi:carboxylesterase
VFKSDTDAVVPPSSLALLRRRLGSRELTVVPLPHSGHVATLDADAPLLFEESVRFFLQHAHAISPPRAPSETP